MLKERQERWVWLSSYSRSTENKATSTKQRGDIKLAKQNQEAVVLSLSSRGTTPVDIPRHKMQQLGL